ncbi:hypothetical protein Hanom_Chr14g01313651 [Helianthus anomalus]
MTQNMQNSKYEASIVNSHNITHVLEAVEHYMPLQLDDRHEHILNSMLHLQIYQTFRKEHTNPTNQFFYPQKQTLYITLVPKKEILKVKPKR